MPLTFLLILALFFNEGAGLSNITPYTAPGIKKIQERGYLIVGVFKEDRMPFFMHNEKGEMIGLDVDIVKKIAKNLGIKKVRLLRTNSFEEAVDCVANGRCDIAASKLSWTPPRGAAVLYTNPYITLNMSLLVNRLKLEQYQQQGLETISQIMKSAHPTITVMADSSYVEFAKTVFPEAQAVSYQDWLNDAIWDVYEGKAFAAFSDEFQTRYVLETVPDAPLKLLLIKLERLIDPFYFIVSRDNMQLWHFINQFMSVMGLSYTPEQVMKLYQPYVQNYIEGIIKDLKTSKYENQTK